MQKPFIIEHHKSLFKKLISSLTYAMTQISPCDPSFFHEQVEDHLVNLTPAFALEFLHLKPTVL